MELIFPVIWLLFGAAAAIAATNKGRSGCGWFILGVLLGPFGLLFALLVEGAQEEGPPEADSAAEKQCPDCAEIVKAEARVCRFCGYRFAA